MSTPVRLALIGAGHWGKKILATLETIEGVHVIVVVTRRRWRLADALDPNVDGVIVATPAETHAEIGCAVLRAGKHLLVEKPMTTTVADAARLLDAARQAGKVVHVDHTDLSNPAWLALARSVDKIGRVQLFEAELGGPPDGRPRVVSARWDWGAHAAAMAVSLFGVPERVGPARRLQRGETELVEVELAWASGAVGRLVVGDAMRERTRRAVVLGEGGTLVYDDLAPDKADATPPLECALRRFVRAVQAGEPDVQDAVLGRDVVRLLAAMDEALRAREDRP